MSSNDEQADNFYTGSIGYQGDNHYYYNGSNLIGSIRDQAVNENTKINNRIGNAWYRDFDAGYVAKFGQVSHNLYYLQHRQRMKN